MRCLVHGWTKLWKKCQTKHLPHSQFEELPITVVPFRFLCHSLCPVCWHPVWWVVLGTWPWGSVILLDASPKSLVALCGLLVGPAGAEGQCSLSCDGDTTKGALLCLPTCFPVLPLWSIPLTIYSSHTVANGIVRGCKYWLVTFSSKILLEISIRSHQLLKIEWICWKVCLSCSGQGSKGIFFLNTDKDMWAGKALSEGSLVFLLAWQTELRQNSRCCALYLLWG